MKKRTLGILSLVALAGGGVLWMIGHCRHKFSRPFTNMPWSPKRTYVVCLKCGGEFDFDMEHMEVGNRRDPLLDEAPRHAVS